MTRRDITDSVREVCSREYRYDTGEGTGGCGIDGKNTRMGMGTAQHNGVQHTRQAEIIDKGALSGHEPRIFKTL
jgi:hypothetical protein